MIDFMQSLPDLEAKISQGNKVFDRAYEEAKISQGSGSSSSSDQPLPEIDIGFIKQLEKKIKADNKVFDRAYQEALEARNDQEMASKLPRVALQFDVRGLDGRRIFIPGLTLQSKVIEVKDIVHQRIPSLPVNQMQLIYAGKQLKNQRTLAWYQFNSADMHLLLRVRGGAPKAKRPRDDDEPVAGAIVFAPEPLDSDNDLFRTILSQKEEFQLEKWVYGLDEKALIGLNSDVENTYKTGNVMQMIKPYLKRVPVYAELQDRFFFLQNNRVNSHCTLSEPPLHPK